MPLATRVHRIGCMRCDAMRYIWRESFHGTRVLIDVLTSPGCWDKNVRTEHAGERSPRDLLLCRPTHPTHNHRNFVHRDIYLSDANASFIFFLLSSWQRKISRAPQRTEISIAAPKDRMHRNIQLLPTNNNNNSNNTVSPQFEVWLCEYRHLFYGTRKTDFIPCCIWLAFSHSLLKWMTDNDPMNQRDQDLLAEME